VILALAGGVGGAKLVEGLSAILNPAELTVVVNTGDDFEHLGLHVSPDLDTMMYTLAGISDPDRGWGLADESWNFMEAMSRLGGETWFRLGDRDLATHVERTRRLAHETLSTVTADLCGRLGVVHPIVPMTDDRVRTIVDTAAGKLAFQEYFVRRGCAPALRAVVLEGIDNARPSPRFAGALTADDLSAVVICPSNPLLSIHPILSLPGVTARLAQRRVPLIAVSPLIAGEAVKGPAAKIMRELGLSASPDGIAAFYGERLDGLVIDHADAALAVIGGRPEVLVTRTLMTGRVDKMRLAHDVVAFAMRLAKMT